jgi:hypothetical protein
MIKSHCSECGSIFLGDSCPCQLGSSPRRLLCDCDQPAVEVYIDDLGEWPLCSDCLALALDEFSPLPLPDFNPSSKPDSQPNEEEHLPDPLDFPFDLTEREYQIVCMYDLTNHQIADELMLSPATIRTHWRNIHEKMNIHSRWEIPYMLGLKPSAKPITAKVPNPSFESSPPAQSSLDVTITLTGQVASISDLVTLLSTNKVSDPI